MVLQILSLLICCTIVQIGHAMTRIKCWKFSKHDLFTCSDVSSHFGTVSCDFELRYLDLWMANFYFVWFPSWLWKLVLPQYFEHFLTYTIKVFYKPHRCNVIFFSSPSSVVALGCQSWCNENHPPKIPTSLLVCVLFQSKYSRFLKKALLCVQNT